MVQPTPTPPPIDLATTPRRFITATALAAYLECHPRTITRMIHAGALKATRVGRDWRIATADARRAFHVAQIPHS